MYPTDSGYALGCMIGDKHTMDRIVTIRKLPEGILRWYVAIYPSFQPMQRSVMWLIALIKNTTPGALYLYFDSNERASSSINDVKTQNDWLACTR